jgi:RNA polymerase sigma factor (sigma-70 family)
MHRRASGLSRGDDDRAEELEQRTQVRMWEIDSRRSGEIRSPAAFRFGVLRKVHQEILREERRHRHLELDGHTSPCPRTDDPACAVERSERHASVRDAVDRLRTTLQVVVRLRYFEGLQQRQIASHLQCNEVRVCRLLKRARETLRLLLDPETRQRISAGG